MRDDSSLSIRLSVDGMTCGKCRGKVESVLAQAPGVLAAKVLLEEGAAEVRYDAAETNPEEIAASITKAGYPAEAGEVETAHLSISGMTCGKCRAKVEAALEGAEGLRSAEVLQQEGRATLRYDPEVTSPEALASVVSDAGYPATVATGDTAGDVVPEDADAPRDVMHPEVDAPSDVVQAVAEAQTALLQIEGMSCASCVGRVEKALSAVPGVETASVNLATGRAALRYAPGSTTPEALAEASTRAGYAATPLTAGQAPRPRANEATILARRAWIAALLAAPVFLGEMGGHLYPPLHHWIIGTLGETPWRVVQFLLTAAVLAGPGRGFFTSGIPALLRWAPEMNALVALGTSAAFLYSTVATFAPGVLPEGANHVYFEAAAVIVVLILLGRTLEARAKGQAGAAIRGLIALTPDVARVDTPEGVQERPIADIAPGDRLLLAPGERVAVDGVVITGESYVDEAMLTGEPIPVAKAPGAALTGGTVNGVGALTYEAQAVGSDTVLARIAGMVEDAQATKLPVQRLIDRITGVFVPVVMAISLVTLLAWLALTGDPARAMVAAVAVLIIACPCAMGLATPVSILVATGRAAELGVLFRKGEALERLGAARRIAFDKTGTLTEGRPALVGQVSEGMADDRALRFAAALEAGSEHPIARAFVAATEGEDLPEAKAVTARPGEGVEGRVDGLALALGAAHMMESRGIALPASLQEAVEEAARNGETHTILAAEGRAVAAFRLADPVKPSTAAALAELRRAGLSLALLSGDTPAAAESLAARVGIGEAHGGMRPEDKAAWIAAQADPVAFVGDGINDAPSLAAAQPGIAIGTGTDVAIEAADVVLMGDDLGTVVKAHEISRRTMANIRQNLAWAFGYNVLLIPVAAGVLVPFGGPMLSPMLGAGAMALSSVLVVSNALRLRRAARD